MGRVLECRERTLEDCTGLILECLGKELNVGKGNYQGSLGRKKYGKIKGKKG